MNVFSYVLSGFFMSIPLVLGIVLVLFPPKKMNNMVYGFHMSETTKDQEAWDYGQKIGGITMLIYSILSISIFVVFLVIFHNFFNEFFYLRMVIGFVLLVLAPIISFLVVNKMTRKYNYKKYLDNKNI